MLSSTFNSGTSLFDTTSVVTENSSSTEIPLLNVSTHLTLIYSLLTYKTCALKYTCPFIVPFSHPNKAIIQLKNTKTDRHLFILNPLEFQ